MTRRARPLVTFRLYPEPGSTLYVRVNVWPTKRAMDAHNRRLHQTGAGAHAAGTCSSYILQRFYGGRWRSMPIVAEVNLHRRRMGTEIVTHEFLHAAIAWARRIRFDFRRLDAHDSVNDDEERLCYAHGRLCREFVRRATDAGLYEET